MLIIPLLTAALLVPVVVVFVPVRVASNHWLWEWAQALGYLAVVSAALLFVYRHRPAVFPRFRSVYFTYLHRDLGMMTCALVIAHLGVLLFAEPLLIEHLTLTAPWHMLSGIAATVLLVPLGIGALPAVRQRLWGGRRRFRRWHLRLSLVFAALLLHHIVGSGGYINHASQVLVLSAMAIAIAVAFARRHRSHDPDRWRTRKVLSISERRAVSWHVWSVLISAGVAILISVWLQRAAGLFPL